MHYHEFLRTLHEVYQPRTYVEIGVDDGRTLALSRAATVAVDPEFNVVEELRCDLHLVRQTSDDFFGREEPFEHLHGAAVDLAFIDGMHLFEFALRDFINVEPYADWTSVAVFDDVLPRNTEEAARERHTTAWSGDVYKIVPVLQRYRPDLVTVVVDTRPTGTLLVFGADPDSTVLRDRYDEVIEEFLGPDPQTVPAETLARSDAVEPGVVLGGSFWPRLVRSRDRARRPGRGRRRGYRRLRAGIAKALR